MFQTWATPVHMDHKDMSISLKPHDYGEANTDPRRTYMAGRAWAIWRARRDGWADARPCRRDEFRHEEERLAKDILAYHAEQAGGAAAAVGAGAAGGAVLLGHTAADGAFRRWVPTLWSHLRGEPP